MMKYFWKSNKFKWQAAHLQQPPAILSADVEMVLKKPLQYQ